MKKIKKLMLVALTFLMTFMSSNVKAIENEISEPQSIKDVCISTPENETTPYVKITMKKDIEFPKNEVFENGIKGYFIGKDDKEYSLLFAKSTDESIKDSQDSCALGELPSSYSSPFSEDVNANDIVLGKQVENHELKVEDIIAIKFEILDKNFDKETLVYDVATGTFDYVKTEHDTATENIFNLMVKYDAFPIKPSEDLKDVKFWIISDDGEESNKFSYKEIIITNFYEKSYEEVTAEFDKILETLVENVIVEENKISEEFLADLKDNKSKVNVQIIDDNSMGLDAIATWIFDGSKISDTDFDLDLGLKVGESTNKESINALIEKDYEKPLNIEFNYHGKLPLGTQVKINVSKVYKDGEKLALGYYNPETKKLELVTKGLYVVDGNVTFDLEHCSEYVLMKDNTTEKADDNNVQTSSMNMLPYVILGTLSLAGIAYLTIAKKKNN